MASVRITFLGTGAGACIHRAHTAIVLDCPDGTRLLLDASSGNSVLRNGAEAGMQAQDFHHLLISHHHADHIMGLTMLELVRGRAAPDAPTLALHGSEETLEGVKLLCQAASPSLKVDQDGATNARGQRAFQWLPAEEGQRVQLGTATHAFSVPVDHIGGAVCWRIESDGVAVVFSGDTRFSPSLVEAARGARLLIHEALSTERDRDFTHEVDHSTAAEAGRAAALAGVEELVITHISTAHHLDPQPLLDEARKHFLGPITIASDLYQLSVGTA